ncbi:class I SAM-dependent methyltransferase [Kocuria rosea]|uniref:class I SAM-dependent methyltransferase n=1 Tax=Kocuria rosea TaxID=1275 RepID=UPI00204195D3|nr:class I SAM-dependent methyltransferase [Kocuria rosea]MCM3688610.1 methyltransferase domain-containing protein [Kocuria rosea]
MTHRSRTPFDPGQHDHHRHEEDLAQLLELDAEMSGASWEEVTTWATQDVGDGPRTIVDLGAGTGAGGVVLARRFPAAQVVAVDRSAVMLERVQATAREQGLDGRVHVVHADLDVTWPAVGEVDLVWASSFLHEVADPGAVLGAIRAALRPGGLLVVVEMDALPRFLPEDLGIGRPGLESRCHQALASAGWNAHPDWRPLLEQTGFEVLGPRTVSAEAHPAPLSTARCAQAWLSHMRPCLRGRLAAEDLDVLDRLLAEDRPEALLTRRDLSIRGSRTAWAARRP